MSGTVMKFGPQWIRTLTDGAAPTSAAASRHSSNNSNQNNPSSTLLNSSPSSSSSNNNGFNINPNQNQQNIINNNNNNNNNSSSSSSSLSANHHLSSNTNSMTNGANGASSSSSSSNSNNNNSNNNNNNNINNNINSTASGKYKLAEYRYGREEMLALFEQEMDAPDDIKKYTDLFVEKARMPMAMTQMSEEEVKLSTRNWNSEAVLRSSGKIAAAAAAAAAPTNAGSGPNSTGATQIGPNMATNLGSTVNDRDNNRQLSDRGTSATLTAASVLSSSPRGPPGSLSRMPVDQRGMLSSLYSRGSTSIRNLVGRNTYFYPRSQSHDDENVDDTTLSNNSSAFDSRFGLSGQARQPNSLRARFDANNKAAAGSTTSNVTGVLSAAGSKPIDIKGGAGQVTSDGESGERRSVYDKLPGKYVADDKIVRKDANGRPTQSGDWRLRDYSNTSIDTRSKSNANDERSWRSTRSGNSEDWRSNNNSSSASSWYVKTNDQRNIRPGTSQNQENVSSSFGGKARETQRRPSADDKQGDEEDVQLRHRRDSLPEWSIGDPLSGDKVGCFDSSGAFREIATDDSGNDSVSKNKNQDDLNGFDHLERAAEIMVAEWTAEEEHEDSEIASMFANKLNLLKEQQDAQTAMLQNSNDVRPQNQSQPQQPEQSQSNTVAGYDSETQKKLIIVPFNHENSQQWYYRDTQGVIQGPFSGSDMFDWYKGGYFVKELLVRRACDELFYHLGEAFKMWDRIPFAPLPLNVPPPAPITTQTLFQFRAVAKQLEMAAGLNASQGQIPPNAFGITHPVLLHAPLLQQQQVHQVLAAASLNQNISAPQEQQADIRQLVEASRSQQQQQFDQSMIQQQQQQQSQQRTHPNNVIDQNEMQTQLRQLLAQLKNREGFSNLNAQEQQEVLVRQFVASRAASIPENMQEPDRGLVQRSRGVWPPVLPFFSSEQQESFNQQQRLELERRQEEVAEKQNRLMMEQRLKAAEEKQRVMEEYRQQQQRQQQQQTQQDEGEKQRQEAERILKMNQLKQQQLAKQHEEFRQQMQNQQRLQQQKQQQQQAENQLGGVQANSNQQQHLERAKKTAQTQQVQQEQRKTAWSTMSKPDQEPVSLATLQKIEEEEKKRENERQRQLVQQLKLQQQHQLQQRQLTWASAAQQQKPAPIKTLAEIQKEEEERLAKEKQKQKAKPQPAAVSSSGVWNNAASHLSWKNPPADP